MSSNRNSDEVVEFLVLLATLKDRCHDDPAILQALVQNDRTLEKLCGRLFHAGNFLRWYERRHRKLFLITVDPKFISEWRDYEERFEQILLDIVFAEFTESLRQSDDTKASEAQLPVQSVQDARDQLSELTSKADSEWQTADDDAREQAAAIEKAIWFGHDQATQYERDFGEDTEEFRDSIEDGMGAWQRLKHEVGFDLRGAFRRRQLIPVIFVPTSAMAVETDSMSKNLQQAHEAFIFGSSLAALGLMRAIMEVVLRDHYGIEARNVKSLIDNARPFLPRDANANALHRLRRLANATLHLDANDEFAPPKMEDVKMEREIISLLYVLRGLIEGVSQRRPSPGL